MHDPLLVRDFERVTNLPRDGQCLVERNRSARDAIRECRTVDQLQHERVDTVGFLKPMNRSDVRMIQRGEELCLALEPHQTIWIERKGCRQDFQRNVSTELVSRARYTCPIPPAPMADWISYTPKRV